MESIREDFLKEIALFAGKNMEGGRERGGTDIKDRAKSREKEAGEFKVMVTYTI
jgi:hypothetical protein